MQEHQEDDDGWGFAEGDEIAPFLYAWDMLGGGLRFETWLAWDAERWCPVTVKLPRPRYVGHPRALAALAREAKAAEALSHPAVQRLLADRRAHSLPHLVMEYVEGPALVDLVEEEGPLHPADVLRLGLQLAAVLHYLHGRGLVHLDVKPHNVVLREGRPVLIDFGFVRPVGTPAEPGPPRGSPPYMAPEQVGRAPAHPSMDLFALGTVLFEAATGEQAFESDDDDYRQLGTPPVAPSSLVPAAPPAFDAAVGRLLAIDPHERPATAAEALAELAAAVPEGEDGAWPAFVRLSERERRGTACDLPEATAVAPRGRPGCGR